MTGPESGRNVLAFNYRAARLDLYDMVAPMVSRNVNVRNAIEEHRAGQRSPVAMSAGEGGDHAE